MNHTSIITICGSALLTAGVHFDKNPVLIVFGSFMVTASLIQWYRNI